ncbi:helix-turn-helix transcriptional regulator [Clostridium sp. P21]|uniref:Helix-turn-helix transcriptional regulator n=1 Tax=Clostridium muellerianum TaxID=2716538 RepID=A0A7Y0EL81_9CLOT|nr:helix-turn-helix transcriptional regulator [Clostridium muellerianum]NMM65467.1 helix-turn-helix transcriptional regulator [Clostridium muellerianum]
MIKCNLNKILEDKKVSKYKLAKNTGIAYNAIKKLGAGDTISITFENLTKICNELDITVGELLENVKDTDNEEKAED